MKLCSITSGSSGNCICVGSDQTTLLIDAGISGKRIECGLNSIDMTTKDVDGILITHEHSDHIKGLGVLARKYGIPIYTTEGTKEAILETSAVGKISEDLFCTIHPDHPFCIGDLEVSPFSVYHDAAEPVGYRINQDGHSIAVATDLGHYDDYIVKHLQGLDALLLEANHDIHMLEVGPYPYVLKRRVMGDKGHLSNELSGRLLCDILHDNLKGVVLGHLSKENNYAELAFETVKLEVTMGNNPYKGEDIPLYVAKRDSISNIITV